MFFFLLGIQYDSIVWVIMRRRGYPQNAGILVVVVYNWFNTPVDLYVSFCFYGNLTDQLADSLQIGIGCLYHLTHRICIFGVMVSCLEICVIDLHIFFQFTLLAIIPLPMWSNPEGWHIEASIMPEWDGWALVGVMACCLSAAKLLPEPMLTHCQLSSQELISMTY